MKKFLIAATALSGLLAFAGSASAADVAVDPGYDWTGPYIGIQGGYGWGTNNYTYTAAAADNDTDIDMDGFVGGATIGANWQHESLVFGLEGDVSFADISGDENTVNDPVPTTPCLSLGEGCTADVDWFGTARARLGFAVDNWMPFIAGGLAFGGIEGTADLGACALPNCDFDKTRFGWTVGGGVEVGFADNWSAKLEYLYVDLGEPSFNAPTVQSDNVDFSVIRAGLNFNF